MNVMKLVHNVLLLLAGANFCFLQNESGWVRAQRCNAAIFLAKGGKELSKYYFDQDRSETLVRFGGPVPMDTIALNPADGLVYGIKNNVENTFVKLFAFNLETAQRGGPVGKYFVGNVHAMAIDETGRIFVQSYNDYVLYQLHLDDGNSFTAVGEMYHEVSNQSNNITRYPFLAQGLAIQGNRWVTIAALDHDDEQQRQRQQKPRRREHKHEKQGLATSPQYYLVVGKLPPKYGTLGLIQLRGIPKDVAKTSSTLMFEPVGTQQLYIGDNKKRTALWRFHGPSSDTLRQTSAVNRISAGFFTDCYGQEE